MTTRRLLCPAVSLALVALSTAALGGPKARNLVQTIGDSGEDRFHAVATMDSAVFFGGFKDGAGGPGEAWLYATDLDGEPLEDLVYRDMSGRPSLIRALATTRKLLLAAGEIGNEATDQDVFAMGLTESGQIVWQRSLELPGHQILGDVLPLADGDVLVVGSTLAPGEIRTDGWVARLDPAGGVRWQKRVGTLGNDGFRSAIETPSGDLLLAGQGGIGRQLDGYQGWIVSMDADGNVLWHQGYELGQSDRVNKLLPTKNGYVGFGVAFETSFQQGQGWILELDDSGGFVNSRLIGDFELFGRDELVDGVETHAGGFIAIGSSETVIGYPQRLFAVEFNGRGVALWLRHFGADGFGLADRAVALRGNRGLVLAGSTQWLGAIDALQIKTVTPPDDGSSCAQIGTVSIRLAPFLPQRNLPFLAVGETAATLRSDDLMAVPSGTARTTLCSF